jgi:ABC-2 type transport system ATP-binding protein
LALITAVCPEPELLVLDEPTSGLDPIVRREFIQTIIGAYQDGDPGRRTVLVSTHLIAEFEGLIDEFTIIDGGRSVLSLAADAARARYQKIYARFAGDPPVLDLGGARVLRRGGRDLEVVVNGNSADVLERLKARSPETLTMESLTLEEIFVATLQPEGVVA